MRRKKYPAGAFRTIHLTSAAHEAMKALEESAFACGAASTQRDLDVAYSVLNVARERLAKRLAGHEEYQRSNMGWYPDADVTVRYA